MRNKNHHLIQRHDIWHLRYDIPKDVRHSFPHLKSPTRMESLKARDVKLARKKRDVKLTKLERIWDRLRQENILREANGNSFGVFNSYKEWAYVALKSEQASEIENMETVLDERFERLHFEEFKPYDHSNEAYLETQEAARNSPLGKELIIANRILEGKSTPIKSIADEWLLTKSDLKASSLAKYNKAIKILTDKYEFIEDITFRDARNFTTELLQKRNKRTVVGYCGAYHGIWGHLGLSTDMWSLKGISSPVKSVDVERWTDDEYLHLLDECSKQGHRDLWLAIRIAAYTGAAAQGVADLQVIEDDNGRSVFLNETKKDTRPRIIPCHIAIYNDVIEWQNYTHSTKSLSKKFTEFKQKLGYPNRTKVLHSFRHACINKLENARVNDREIKRVVGHKLGSVTYDTYNREGLDYHVLFEIISKLNWPHVKHIEN